MRGPQIPRLPVSIFDRRYAILAKLPGLRPMPPTPLQIAFVVRQLYESKNSLGHHARDDGRSSELVFHMVSGVALQIQDPL